MTHSTNGSVFESDDEQAINLIADFLKEKGVGIEVVEHQPEVSQTDTFGMTATSFGAAESSRFEVVVRDEGQLAEARQLLTKHTEEILRRADLVQLSQSEVVVECEDCEKTNVYSGELQGTVQECEHCGTYLDVPGGEDDYDWSVVDETLSEEEQAAEEQDDETDAWG